MKNTPYNFIENYSRWKNIIQIHDNKKVLDLKTSSAKFKVTKESKIASAGSCFAQYVALHFKTMKFNYLEMEDCSENAGFFSANYGNIYTTRQLLEFFNRAYSDNVEISNFWISDNIYIDKFRHSQGPLVFQDDDQAILNLKNHLHSVRSVFKNADFFVYTLGLTEAWQEVDSGMTFPTCPGTVAGNFDVRNHVFKNFSFSEVKSDLEEFIEKLVIINPRIKIILTVSPVPLAATAINQNVAISNSYSKSVLRAVAGEVSSNFDNVDYFPSYELFSLPQFENLYDIDNRNPKKVAVDTAMTLFNQYFVEDSSLNYFLNQYKIICDESNYDKG